MSALERPAEGQSEASEESRASCASPHSLSLRGRLYAAALCLCCLGVLGLAARLEPDSKGYGTHRQLGFGKCGMLVTTGLPCPTCGMTTAYSYMVRGRLIRAFMAQPAGLLLGLATVGAGVVAGWSAVRGRTPAMRVPWFNFYRVFLALLVVLVGSWAFVIFVGLANGTLPDRG